jgi:hypothetical protein
MYLFGTDTSFLQTLSSEASWIHSCGTCGHEDRLEGSHLLRAKLCSLGSSLVHGKISQPPRTVTPKGRKEYIFS